MTITNFPEFAAQVPTKGVPVTAASQANFVNFVSLREQNVYVTPLLQADADAQILEIDETASGLVDLEVEDDEVLDVNVTSGDDVAILLPNRPTESKQNLPLSLPATWWGNEQLNSLVIDASGLDMKNLAGPAAMVAGPKDVTAVIVDKDIALVTSVNTLGPQRARNSVNEGILNWRMSGEVKLVSAGSTSIFPQEAEAPRETIRPGALALVGDKAADAMPHSLKEVGPIKVGQEVDAESKIGSQLHLTGLNSKDNGSRHDLGKLELRSDETRVGSQSKASDTTVPVEHWEPVGTSNRQNEKPESSLLPPWANGLENDKNKAFLNSSEFDQLAPISDVARLSTSSPSILGIDAKSNMQQQMASAASQQIAVAISKNPDGVTELSLSPEELGRVSLSMKIVDGVMSVSITTERPETQELIRRHIETLAQEFRSLGYQDVGFHFSEQSADGQSKDADEHQTQFANLKVDSIEAVSENERIQSAGLDLRL